jgi:hypothetical protein
LASCRDSPKQSGGGIYLYGLEPATEKIAWKRVLSKSPAIIKATERTDYRIVPRYTLSATFMKRWIPQSRWRAAPKRRNAPADKEWAETTHLSASAHVYLCNHSQNRKAFLAFIPRVLRFYLLC